MKILSKEEIERQDLRELITGNDPVAYVLWNICYQLARLVDKLSAIEHHGLKIINRG